MLLWLQRITARAAVLALAGLGVFNHDVAVPDEVVSTPTEVASTSASQPTIHPQSSGSCISRPCPHLLVDSILDLVANFAAKAGHRYCNHGLYFDHRRVAWASTCSGGYWWVRHLWRRYLYYAHGRGSH